MSPMAMVLPLSWKLAPRTTPWMYSVTVSTDTLTASPLSLEIRRTT